MLEVLKWTSYLDLCALSLVNSLWHKAANSEEVWDLLCKTCGLEGQWSGLKAKTAFRRQIRESRRFMLANEYLRSIDVGKMIWEKPVKLQKCTNFGNLSSLILNPPFLIVTGTADPVTGQSALINYTSGSVALLPSMLNPRCNHCSVLFQGSVYVFAGANGRELYTDTAEKLVLHRAVQWTALARLQCKAGYLSSCRKGTLLYLISGCGTNICQLFDIRREEFSVLAFKMPRSDAITRVIEEEGYIYFAQMEWKGRWTGDLDTLPVMYRVNTLK